MTTDNDLDSKFKELKASWETQISKLGVFESAKREYNAAKYAMELSHKEYLIAMYDSGSSETAAWESVFKEQLINLKEKKND